jgi:hypothetical protein
VSWVVKRHDGLYLRDADAKVSPYTTERAKAARFLERWEAWEALAKCSRAHVGIGPFRIVKIRTTTARAKAERTAVVTYLRHLGRMGESQLIYALNVADMIEKGMHVNRATEKRSTNK